MLFGEYHDDARAAPTYIDEAFRRWFEDLKRQRAAPISRAAGDADFAILPLKHRAGEAESATDAIVGRAQYIAT